MLAGRGLLPSLARPGFPFPSDVSAETADALAERLGYCHRRNLDLVAPMTNIGRGLAERLLAQHPQLV
jgi:hypothetical protein